MFLFQVCGRVLMHFVVARSSRYRKWSKNSFNWFTYNLLPYVQHSLVLKRNFNLRWRRICGQITFNLHFPFIHSYKSNHHHKISIKATQMFFFIRARFNTCRFIFLIATIQITLLNQMHLFVLSDIHTGSFFKSNSDSNVFKNVNLCAGRMWEIEIH